MATSSRLSARPRHRRHEQDLRAPLARCLFEAATASDLPASRYMGYPYGWMVARTGWDADSVIAEMKVNIFNFGNHQHLDCRRVPNLLQGPAGHRFGALRRRQRPLRQSSPPELLPAHYRAQQPPDLRPQREVPARPRRAKQTMAARDCRIMAGEASRLDQFLNGNFRTGEVLGENFGPDPQTPAYTYLKGDLTSAYSSKVREVKRSFVFPQSGRRARSRRVPAVMIVFDKVVAADPASRNSGCSTAWRSPKFEERPRWSR